MTAGETLLRAGSLVKHYHPPRSWLAPRQPPVVAVDNVSLDVIAGETLGLSASPDAASQRSGVASSD